jgi:hypothetical protein
MFLVLLSSATAETCAEINGLYRLLLKTTSTYYLVIEWFLIRMTRAISDDPEL